MTRNILRAMCRLGLPAALVMAAGGEAHAQTTCGTSAPLLTCTKRPHTRLNINTFANTIADSVKAMNLKGFALSVYGEDGHPDPILTIQQGLASGPAETTIAHTPLVAQAVASVSKLIVESAIRHAIEINNDADTPACEVNISTPFLNVLPAAFSRAAGPGTWYTSASVEHVLQHRAGVPNTPGTLPDGHPDLWSIMAKPAGHTSCTLNTRCYANQNYLLATMMLPLIRDCSLRASLESEAATFCRRNLIGPDKDTCEMQYAYDQLSLRSNTIVKEMVMDPLNASASCNYTQLIAGNVSVARGFASQSAASGIYVPVEERSCAAGGWHMSTKELGRVARRMWDGSFFNHASTGFAMPEAHNGGISLFLNGGQGEWRSLAMWMMPTALGSESVSAAFVANSPVDTDTVYSILYNAFESAAASSPAAVNQGVFTPTRGRWSCARTGAPSQVVSLRIANRYDIKLFGPLDFSGQGSEELWTPTTVNTNSASGTFVFYRAGTSPKANFGVSRGTFSLTRNATTGGVSFTRTINGSSAQTFTCTLQAD
jgi:hypothetical protein